MKKKGAMKIRSREFTHNGEDKQEGGFKMDNFSVKQRYIE